MKWQTPASSRLSDGLELFERIQPRIRSGLNAVHRVPVSVLVWGPGIDSSSPLSSVRATLRATLRQSGHTAFYSEELCDPGVAYSIRLQQLAQAQQSDLVVSLPSSPGSIGEVHDFAADRRVTAKILIFLNQQYLDGYSSQSIQTLSSIISCHIEYCPNESETACILEVTLNHVQRIRELKYLMAGRY